MFRKITDDEVNRIILMNNAEMRGFVMTLCDEPQRMLQPLILARNDSKTENEYEAYSKLIRCILGVKDI